LPAAPSRRPARVAHLALALLCLVHSRDVTAEGANVPPGVQAQLVSKVPAYDRGFRARAAPRVHVLVLYKAASPESVRLAKLVTAALEQQVDIAGLPHGASALAYSDPAALAAETKKRSASIVYVPPGFSSDLDAVCGVLQPLKVMTITPVSEYVRRCLVLGFELESGKTKLVVHLENSKKSGIRFSSELLRLAKVHR
jgi:hypothetical protein